MNKYTLAGLLCQPIYRVFEADYQRFYFDAEMRQTITQKFSDTFLFYDYLARPDVTRSSSSRTD